jgi:hypothetical protein
MADGDGEVVEQVLGALGDSLESSLASAITAPAIGWVAALFGLSAGGGNNDDAALANLQTGVYQILGDINQLASDLETRIDVANGNLQIAPAVAAVVQYQRTGAPPSTMLSLLPGWLNTLPSSDFLATVHQTLVGPGTTGTVGYLTTFRQAQVPRYTSDTSPDNQLLGKFFMYHQKLQASLMQMNVEAAHQGQSASTAASSDHSGPLPPNYVGAIQAYQQYGQQIAEQSTFLPLPTSGVGYRYDMWIGGFDFGATQIVFDQKKGFAWGASNLASTANVLSGTIPLLQSQLSMPPAWMVRAPTYAELQDLHAAFVSLAGTTVAAADMLTFLTNAGFNLALDPTVSTPFVTAECFDQANWTLINPVWSKHRPPDGTIIANGYQCDWFYDLLNGVPVTVQINCDVSEGVFTGANGFGVTGGLAFFATIPSTASVTRTSAAGTQTVPYIDAYTDALFVYQLAEADSATQVSTDPPLEEPSKLQLTQVTNADGSVTCTARASFTRLNRTSGSGSVTLNVPNVYWSVDTPDAATIDQNGHLVWKVAGTTLYVYATRGPVTSSIQVGPAAPFTPPAAATPSQVNIYPRNVVLSGSLPAKVSFSGQILYSDGSTSPATDGVADDTQFTWTASGNIQLAPNTPRIDSVSHVNVQAAFVIPEGTTETVQVTLTLKDSQLTDTATITIGS